MTGFGFDPALVEALTESQGERLAGILVSVGLSNSQASQIVRRMNEPPVLPRKEPKNESP